MSAPVSWPTRWSPRKSANVGMARTSHAAATSWLSSTSTEAKSTWSIAAASAAKAGAAAWHGPHHVAVKSTTRRRPAAWERASAAPNAAASASFVTVPLGGGGAGGAIPGRQPPAGCGEGSAICSAAQGSLPCSSRLAKQPRRKSVSGAPDESTALTGVEPIESMTTTGTAVTPIALYSSILATVSRTPKPFWSAASASRTPARLAHASSTLQSDRHSSRLWLAV